MTLGDTHMNIKKTKTIGIRTDEHFLKLLGPVDNHLEAISAATRFQHAA